LWLESHGGGGFVSTWSWWVDALLIFGGVLTALPLIGFSYAVRRVPYSVVGFMQYIAPTLQLLIGVLVFHEVFDRDRAIGFIFIWIGLLIFAVDGVVRSRRI
jgi:chloramphenicol-sensitive protein RarD